MSRPFRPNAKMPVHISFISYNRPKKTVWPRGFVKIVENGECIELSNNMKQHEYLPIERLYKSRLHGTRDPPYIFSFRLDANHPDNRGQKLIRLKFKSNLEGYQYAINTINKAFEIFADRFSVQAKKIPGNGSQEDTKARKLEKGKMHDKRNKEKKEGNVTENLQETESSRKEQQKEHKIVLKPLKSFESWPRIFDHLLGPDDSSHRKHVNPDEEERLAEIRRRNDKKLEEQREEKRKKRAQRSKENEAKKSQIHERSEKDPEDSAAAKRRKLDEELGMDFDLGEINEKGEEKKEDSRRIWIYGFGDKTNRREIFSEVADDMDMDAESESIVKRAERKAEISMRLALRQGEVVKKQKSTAGSVALASGSPARKSSEMSAVESSGRSTASEPTQRAPCLSGGSSGGSSKSSEPVNAGSDQSEQTAQEAQDAPEESSFETSGYSSGDPEDTPLKEVKLEPVADSEIKKVGRKTFVGMSISDTILRNSRIVNCDVQNCTIIDCHVENSTISKSTFI